MSGPASAAPSAGPGPASAFRTPVAIAVNHLLKSAAWAGERLRPHAGKTVRFNLAPFSAALTILPSGEVADAAAGSADDICLTLTPGIALRVLAAADNAWQQARVDGDTALARDILYVAQNLRWDVEEDLSRLFGDIAAHRMVQAGNDFRRWQRATADSLARSAAAYWTEEQPLIATREDVERFVHDVDALRDDVARIEKRIEQLTARGERR